MNLLINKILGTDRIREYFLIWYEFKNGQRIDLNKVLIEDVTGKYQWIRYAGQIKIRAWQADFEVANKKRVLPLLIKIPML